MGCRVFQRHYKLFSSLNAALCFDCPQCLFPLHLISFNFPGSRDGIVSPPLRSMLWLHPVLHVLPITWWDVVLGMPVLGVCYPSYSPPDTMVHLRCLKNSALQLSRALRKYFLSLMQQQSEMPNMVKKACGTGGGKWSLISLSLSSALIMWSSHCLIWNLSPDVEQACQTAFFIFLSSLLVAQGVGEEWSSYMLGSSFDTFLLSSLSPLLSYIPSHVKSDIRSLLHLGWRSLCSCIYTVWTFSSLPSVLMLQQEFLGPSCFSFSVTSNSRQPTFSAFAI